MIKDEEKNIIMISEIKKLASKILPKGSSLKLFGSRARGNHRADSDWDIHILIPDNKNLSFSQLRNYAYPFEEMGWDYGEEVRVMIYTIDNWNKRSFLPLYKNIENEGILL